jgi:hypothetical protein
MMIVILLSERNAKTLGPGIRAFSPFQLYGQEPQFERYRFLIGRIDYKDAFSVSHWNTFCFFIDTNGALRYCREGNEEDRNPEVPTIPVTFKNDASLSHYSLTERLVDREVDCCLCSHRAGKGTCIRFLPAALGAGKSSPSAIRPATASSRQSAA